MLRSTEMTDKSFLHIFCSFYLKETVKVYLCMRRKRPDTFDQVIIWKGQCFKSIIAHNFRWGEWREGCSLVKLGQVFEVITAEDPCTQPRALTWQTLCVVPSALIGREGQSYKRERGGKRGKASLCLILENKNNVSKTFRSF